MWEENSVPIQEIILESTNIRLFLKREDLIHPYVSGNKFWKLKLALQHYLKSEIPHREKCVISFGGAYSNHITALAYACNALKIKSIGVIRGDELKSEFDLNPSLQFAKQQQMELCFVSREEYRDKLQLKKDFEQLYPNALIIPEGGSNQLAVDGVEGMLHQTKDFDYLCSAIGTGGTFAGIVRFSEKHQKCIGIQVVKDDVVPENIEIWSGSSDFELMHYKNSRYGQLNKEEIVFMNEFYHKYNIKLDPIYTVKLMKCIFDKIENNEFLSGSKILCFHTGGMQSLEGMKVKLAKKMSYKIEY